MQHYNFFPTIFFTRKVKLDSNKFRTTPKGDTTGTHSHFASLKTRFLALLKSNPHLFSKAFPENTDSFEPAQTYTRFDNRSNLPGQWIRSVFVSGDVYYLPQARRGRRPYVPYFQNKHHSYYMYVLGDV